MTRQENIQEAAAKYVEQGFPDTFIAGFLYGAMWAEQHPNWISVKDELPPENCKTQQSISVLATDGLTSGEFRYNFDTKTWTDMFGDPFDITHWIPLLQPPRKEE
jgi:hypothetical protein